ncbi:Aste57867_7501 [Aphanomyces stellatus]|uniref:Aste57867_7501 protein n=1 Tax=Aphanomyces stellatus TaxID=120398 RepID=A0A485KIE3_9STRA|nr:hypothetical protein As57867_007475 [Aphanomyces stellatus]VFT84410.1 Aste57867_7501 [Aphanomyces stellatus]
MFALARTAARVPKSFSAVSMRSFATDKFAEKEKAEEARYFNKEDEKALRKLLSKLKEQTDAHDHEGKKSQDSVEKQQLTKILGAGASASTVEALLKWKHQH